VTRQVKHIRRSKYGRIFRAGSRYRMGGKSYSDWIDNEVLNELKNVPLRIREMALEKNYTFDVVYSSVSRKSGLTPERGRFRELLKNSLN